MSATVKSKFSKEMFRDNSVMNSVGSVEIDRSQSLDLYKQVSLEVGRRLSSSEQALPFEGMDDDEKVKCRKLVEWWTKKHYSRNLTIAIYWIGKSLKKSELESELVEESDEESTDSNRGEKYFELTSDNKLISLNDYATEVA